jgi:hypothetical protein
LIKSTANHFSTLSAKEKAENIHKSFGNLNKSYIFAPAIEK